MKDWRGTPIHLGAIVVYPSRQGSRLWMSEGEVVGIRPFTVRRNDSQRTSHPAVERVTVIEPGLQSNNSA